MQRLMLRTGARPAWRALVLACAYLFFAPIAAQALVAGSVGEVAKVRGEAHILRGGSDLAAAQGAAVETRDTLKTGAEARMRIDFADGSMITLGENTTVSVDRFATGGNGRNVLLTALNGIVSAVASKSADGSFDYKIRTKGAYSTVRGTRWVVDAEEGTASFHVLEGLVEVGSSTGNRVLVPAGKSVTVGGAGRMGPVESTSPEDLQRLLNATELASTATPAPAAPAPTEATPTPAPRPQRPADNEGGRRDKED